MSVFIINTFRQYLFFQIEIVDLDAVLKQIYTFILDS